MPEVLRRARCGPPDAREALQGRAGLRVHHRGRQSSSCSRRATASAPRMAALEVRGGHGQGEADRLEDGASCAIRPISSTSCCAPVFDRGRGRRRRKVIATGLPAGPGAASGQIYLQRRPRRRRRPSKGEKVLLVRVETSPEDLRGMIAAEGILTARGGVSVARRARRPPDGQGLRLRRGGARGRLRRRARVTVDGKTFKEGDWLSIDGTAGEVYRRASSTTAPSEIVAGAASTKRRGREEDREVQALPAADEVVPTRRARMRVRTNADTPGADRERHRVRRRRHRPVPHRAHVLRGRPHRRDARDDPRRDRRGPREAALAKLLPYPARRLRRHLPRAQGLPGDDPLPRPAAARVPAARRRRQQAELAEEARRPGRRRSQPARRGAARVQPDARLPRLPPRHRLSRRSPTMQARAVFEAAADGPEGRHQGPARDHDPAGRLQEGARPAGRRSCTPSAADVLAEQSR